MRIKQAQVQVDARDRWFATLALQGPAEVFARKVAGAGEIGIDVGLTKFAALSDGTLIENPRHFRASEQKLAEAQRVVARRRRGSRRHRSAKAAASRIHARVAEQRRDFHHQLSARLVAEFGFIAVEDLNIRGLARGMLAKSVHDAGWAQLISFLKYKLKAPVRAWKRWTPAARARPAPSSAPPRRRISASGSTRVPAVT